MKSLKLKTILTQKLKKKKKTSTKLSKYNVAFNYFGKALIVLSATSRGVYVVSFASVIGVSESES